MALSEPRRESGFDLVMFFLAQELTLGKEKSSAFGIAERRRTPLRACPWLKAIRSPDPVCVRFPASLCTSLCMSSLSGNMHTNL